MKKILFLFAISYSLLAIFPPPASADSADCILRNTGTCSIYPDTSIECPVPGVTPPNVWCCPTDGDCNDLNLRPQPAAPPAAGAETPTCDGGTGTPTALGCIPNEPAQAIPLILKWAIGVGGGLAFLLMLYGAFTLVTAAGNPEHVDKGKSIVTSAVAGLLFIIFSVVLLRIIGIEILKL